MNTSADRPAGSRRHRVWHRVWYGLAGGLLLLVALVGTGEALGWPFLAGPLERLASKRLGRPVTLTDPAASTGFNVRFLGGMRLRAPVLQIGSPAWSQAPYLVKADDLTLALRYGDLWRAHRGAPLHIKSLSAATLDAHLDRLKDGRASWQFQDRPVSADAAVAWPVFDRLLVQQGTLRYHDEPLDTQLEVRLSLRDGSTTTSTTSAASAASAAEMPARTGSAGASGIGSGIGIGIGTSSASTSASATPTAAATASAQAAGSTVQVGAAAETQAGLHAQATGSYRNKPVTLMWKNSPHRRARA